MFLMALVSNVLRALAVLFFYLYLNISYVNCL